MIATDQLGLPVLIAAADPLSLGGLHAALRARPEVRLVAEADVDERAVIVAMFDRLDETVVRRLRAYQAQGVTRLVLVAAELGDPDLLTVVELGVRAVVLRCDATPETLVRLVRVAAADGEATLPPKLLGRL